MAQVVIADAGPLIAFAAIDRLAILQTLFSGLVITESLRNEYSAKPGADTRRIDAAVADGWLVVRVLENAASGPLSPGLGQGESDSIRLAIEDAVNSLLILDDRLARRYALRQGLNIVGTACLLHIAERHDLNVDAGQCVCEMAQIGYRISTGLLDRIREGNKS